MIADVFCTNVIKNKNDIKNSRSVIRYKHFGIKMLSNQFQRLYRLLLLKEHALCLKLPLVRYETKIVKHIIKLIRNNKTIKNTKI